MIYYYCGENIFLSRQRLFQAIDQLKTKNSPARVIKIEKENFEKEKYQQLLSGQNLLGEKIIALIENFSSFPAKRKKELSDLLLKIKGVEIFIWENKYKQLPERLIKHPDGFKEFRFPQPKTIFRLGDLIYPGNQKVFLPILAKLLEKQPPELIYFFLKRHFHLLFLYLTTPHSLKIPIWRKKKLAIQSGKFPPEKLCPFYRQLIELDYKNKSGKLQMGFEFALVNLLSEV